MVPNDREREPERGWESAAWQGQARLRAGNMRLLLAGIEYAREASESEV